VFCRLTGTNVGEAIIRLDGRYYDAEPTSRHPTVMTYVSQAPPTTASTIPASSRQWEG
jgi:hypothetical protein